jgi:hypothetical protein
MNGVLHGDVHGRTFDWIDSPGAIDGRAVMGKFSMPPTDGARASALQLACLAALGLERMIGT